MPKVKFLAYLRRLSGVKTIDLGDIRVTVSEALRIVVEKYPELGDSILGDVPEVSLILGDKNLLIPNDMHLIVNDDLTIGPIVAGGLF